MNFGQIVTAMVTPFDAEGEIDFEETRNLIEHLFENGTDSIVVSGTTGESPTLSTSEKVELFKFTAEVVNGRMPVIAGTGSNNTRESIELTRLAEQAGVDAVMLTTPYYNKPCQEGLFQHFEMIATATSLPIMLYNVPGRSAISIDVETVVGLSEIPNIVSIKEASGSLEAMALIIEQTPENFTLYSGDDDLTLPVLSIGGTGIVSVASHVVGNEMKTMMQHFNNGKTTLAAKAHRKLLPVMKALFAAPNPTPVKAALNLAGLEVGGVRLPLVPLNEAQTLSLEETLTTYAATNKKFIHKTPITSLSLVK